jgi:hypothetical protein
MANDPNGAAAASAPASPSLDEALSGMTVDDALAGMKPEDLSAGSPPPSPGGGSSEPSIWSGNTDEAIAASNKQVGHALGAVGTGAAKAMFELKDFIFGEPNKEDKWAVRQAIEDYSAGLRKQSGVNGVVEGITQFGVGFMGLGKIKYVAKGIEAAQKAGKAAHWAAGSARGAATGAIFMDPHEERLSNLVQSYPGLRNPVTNYLAAKPEDSAAEGRLKNALEGIVLDAALTSALVAVSKSIKLFRAGDIDGANAAAAEADTLFAKAADENYQAKQFFDHDEFLAQREAAAADAERAVAQADPQAGGSGKNFLAAPEEAQTPVPGDRIDSGELGVALKQPRVDGPVQLDQPQGPVQNPGPIDPGEFAVAMREPGASGGPRARNDGDPGVGDWRSDVPPSDSPSGAGGAGSPRGAAENVRGEGAAGGPGGSSVQGVRAGAELPQAGPTIEETEKALSRLRTDNNALSTYGSREAAIDAGYRFKGRDDASGVIPWQKLRTTEETQAWMGQVLDDQSVAINAKRGGNAQGVMTDKQIDRMIEQRSKAWNEDPAQLRGELEAAGENAPQLAAQMETSFLIANKAFQDAYELGVRINNANYSGFTGREEALQALRTRMALATSMYGNAKAISSNAARALRRMRGEFQFTDQQLANIHNSDPEGLLRVVTETGGDPQLLAQTGRLTAWQSIRDSLGALYAANFLWSWKSQVINFATSATQIIWRPLETGVGSIGLQAVGAVKYVLRGDEHLIAQARTLRSQSIREVTYTAGMLQDGLQAATKAFLDGDSILVPHAQEHFAPGAGASSAIDWNSLRELYGGLLPMRSVDDVVHNAVSLGIMGKAALTANLRALGAADEFVKTIRYRNVVAAKASVEADQRGLTGQAAKDFITDRVNSSFDDLGRGIDADAVREAQTSVFQNDYIGPGEGWFGPIASGYANLVATTPVLRVITPFIKTPTNLFRYGVKLTPGLNLLQKEYATALMGAAGPEAQGRAMGQMMLGTMMASSAAMMWASGRLTGSGPQDYDQKNQWLAQGNRPYSIVWTNEKGEKQYFELSRFDPLGMPLSLVADGMNMIAGGTLREDEQENVLQAISLAFVHLSKDKTYIKNLSDFMGAITDDKKMDSWVRRMAPGFVPMSSLMSSVNPDPVLHELRHWYDGILAKTPGWSASLPPKRDFLGDPILAPQGFVSTLKNSPLTDALNEVYAVTGRYIEPPAPRSGATGGVDLRDFTLKNGRSAYDRYQELAGHPPGMPSMKERLTALVQSEAYKQLPHGGPTEHGTKLGLIMERGIKPYREAAFKRLLMESPELRQAVNQRRLDLSKAVASGAKSVQAAGGQARMDVLGDFLKQYGISLPTVNLPSQ